MNPLVWKPNYGGNLSGHTLYPGFPFGHDLREEVLPPGDMMMINLQPGDLLKLSAQKNKRNVFLGAVNSKNDNALQRLGFEKSAIRTGIDCSGQRIFDQRELIARLHARNFDISLLELTEVLLDHQEDLLLKTTEVIECLIAAPESGNDLVIGATCGNVLLSIKHADGKPSVSPALLGEPREEFVVAHVGPHKVTN